ncbi:MAG: hypothetical protein P4L33_09805 [Capsulimonadaceae bacterium]|nr:hypothetical protein [Capsulimonadaceae bacterium]
MSKKNMVAAAAAASLAALIALILVGCGGGEGSPRSLGGSTSATANTRVYQGSSSTGDAWSWTITTSSSTFSATNAATGNTYSGTWASVSSGYIRLTIKKSTDTNVTVPTVMYGLEVPNTMFIAKPVGANTKPIMCAALGTAPAGPDVTYNYIHIPEVNYAPDSGDAFGTLDFVISGNAFTGTQSRFNITGTALNPATVPYSLTCNNGLLSGGAVTGGITASGVAILDYGPNLGGMAAVQAAASPVDINAISAATYRGIHYNPTDGTFMVYGAAGSSGISLGTFSSLETNSQNPNYGTITFTGQPSPGQLTATITYTAGGSANAVFVENTINGKYVLFGIVRHPAGTAHLVLVQQ